MSDGAGGASQRLQTSTAPAARLRPERGATSSALRAHGRVLAAKLPRTRLRLQVCNYAPRRMLETCFFGCCVDSSSGLSLRPGLTDNRQKAVDRNFQRRSNMILFIGSLGTIGNKSHIKV